MDRGDSETGHNGLERDDIIEPEDTEPVEAVESTGSTSSPEKLPTRRPSKASTKHAKAEAEEVQKKPNIFKRTWQKTGLDLPSVMIMAKAALPPTIALAMFQSDVVANQYTTLGYLIAIASVLGFCIMPRAKFLQTMLINIVAVCIGDAMALLALWTAVQARKHTTPAGVSPAGYNASASAVCAIWLFFQVYLVNALRSANPQLQFPAILYSIFVNVAMTFGPQFPTEAACISFAKRLLEAFLTGFAIATAVSLLVFPISSRMVVFKEFTGYIAGMRGLLKAQTKYMASLEDEAMFRAKTVASSQTNPHPDQEEMSSTKSPEAKALKGAVEGLRGLHGTLSADLTFAKREVAWGKLDAADISRLYKEIRAVFLPLAGLSSLIDIFQRIAEVYGWDSPVSSKTNPKQSKLQHLAAKDWADVMKTLHEPFSEITAAMDEAFEHVLLTLEFVKRPKKKKGTKEDVEEKGDVVKPGDPGFRDYFDGRSHAFYCSRETTLRKWCEDRGIDLPEGDFEAALDWPHADWVKATDAFDKEHKRDQRQLFVVLYMEYLLWSASRSLLKVVEFADSKVTDGTMKKNRIIFPGLRRMKKWFWSVFSPGDTSSDNHEAMASMDAEQTISMGEAYSAFKNPEHLAPSNWHEKLGDMVRGIPRLLRSGHSVFGFRVACATMSIGIVAYLRDSYVFFTEQRLVWAMIMVAISMTRTAGQSTFNFILRVFGTLVAMIASYIVYYIVDGKTAGIVVFTYIWIFMAFYVVVKMPKYVVIGIISAITVILIIGYELQTRKIGVATATSNGQKYYPIYLLAPYRLACVAGGLTVAFIWTIFPYPISENSELRQDCARAMYLLANHYSVTHETIGARIRGDEGDVEERSSPGYRLEKARQKIYAKETQLLQKLRTSSQFSKWQIHIGGKFPKDTYDNMVNLIESIVSYTALMSYASHSFEIEGENETEWIVDFRKLLSTIEVTSHEITSTLCLLQSSVSNGVPLPPYMNLPKPYRLLNRLRSMDKDILNVSHIAEPGYAAFAVLQIASRCIISDLHKLYGAVKELVGELDFSYHIVSTTDTSPSSSRTLLTSEKGAKED